MERYLEYYRIAALIAANLTGEISLEEKARLEKWLKDDNVNQQIYERIVARLEAGETIKSYRNRSVVESDWKIVKNKLTRKQAVSWFRRPLMQYAAVVALVFGVGIAAFYIQDSKKKYTSSLVVQQENIHTGTNKAMLTLANGEQVVLENNKEEHFLDGDVVIAKKQGELTYQDVNSIEDTCEVFNIITTPKGGEYKLMLADGTRVWVNSESELKYPVKFMGNTRTIYIRGEAYFEVAHNAQKPFVVKAPDDMSVRVLGTHFNVSAYETDEEIATTLAEGKIEVSDGEEVVVLNPDQQALFDRKEKSFTCRDVNAYQYLSWKDGKLIFENETLENIMERLGRWYNIQVFFKNDNVKKLRFSGDLEKYNDFSIAVRMLEKVSRIKVEINETAIYIEEK